MDSSVFQISTIIAPEPTFGQRGLPKETTVRTVDFWDKYDNSTLIFDCVWLADTGVVRLFLPKPFNFVEYLRSSQMLLDDQPAKIVRWRKFRHHDEIDLNASHKPESFALLRKQTRLSTAVNASRPELFAGRNVLYTMLKNDDLQWVHDWGFAHQRNHGTDAILVVNNDSDAYTSRQLLQTLRAIPGIKVAHVLDAPPRYGPSGDSCLGAGSTKFLQTACLNIARDRFLRNARAVVVCDVDELVFSRRGRSIYDATVNSLTRYKTFNGYWRFASTIDGLVRHKDHTYADKASAVCASKYCIVPDSFFGRMCWSVHSLENVNRRIFRPGKHFGFYHCHAVNTSWKSARTAGAKADGTPDTATSSFLKATFSASD